MTGWGMDKMLIIYYEYGIPNWEEARRKKNGITSFPLRWFRKTKFSGLAQKAKAGLLSFTLQLHYSSALFIFEFQFYNTENEDSERA